MTILLFSRFKASTVCIIPIFLLLAFAVPTLAQTSSSHAAPAKDPLSITLTARKVVKHGKNETYADAGHARPGDVIEYRAVYSNTGKTPLQGIVATLPLPLNTVYIANSSHPDNVTASTQIDGVYAPVPLMRATGESGRQTAVPLADYRAMRWQLGKLKPGESREVAARVQVAGNVGAETVATDVVPRNEDSR